MTTQQGEAQSQDAVVERSLAGQGVPGQDPQAAAEAEGHQPGAEQEQAVKKPAPKPSAARCSIEIRRCKTG